MDTALFTAAIKLNDYVKRNITYVATPQEAFSSLFETDDPVDNILESLTHLEKHLSKNHFLDDFYYTTAIEYPFKTQPHMHTRYSDGTYPVWYGSMSIETTVYETLYHGLDFLRSIDNIESEKTIMKKRSLFNVFCDALVINLLGKEESHPELISNDYTFTYELGKSIREGGYPGLMSASARHLSGKNVSIFKKSVLKNAKFLQPLHYNYHMTEGYCSVEGLEKKFHLSFDDLGLKQDSF